MTFSAIITAGGISSRYSKNKNKLLEKINGKEIIRYTVESFCSAKIEKIIIPANSTIIETLKKILPPSDKIIIIEGGKSRQESVYKALQYVNSKYVLIHDGARPLISPALIENIIEELPTKKAITLMTKTTDTIKEVDPETGKILKTLDRKFLYNTQTPQAFDTKLIKNVHEQLKNENFSDDAGMVELMGYDVFMLEGDYTNIKITTQTDLDIAKTYLI